MSNFAMDDPSFYEDFLVEAQEHFELIEQNFLSLEENRKRYEILQKDAYMDAFAGDLGPDLLAHVPVDAGQPGSPPFTQGAGDAGA